ncbi:hypothetical protein SH584_11370 [Sphingomonas sp. LY29]|uniref:hypothetical protein n=1 Tax=Sphingomonas sp. LY29 TaxID=3095341 RepID=UPI002D782C59|nr:hypothetical protein [Sphingomonas sp. LY29]WRP25631.1 hypothetical protein SH584_11370 [Sphingomonas sp. LY29]
MKLFDRLFRRAELNQAASLLGKRGNAIKRERNRARVCAKARQLRQECGLPDDPRLAA